ncbi:MAG: glycosyltransferase family 4 protein [Actinobacteria bacterium]|nr:glycosyltransferase family 4 protein [Actinomycetota bacterium]
MARSPTDHAASPPPPPRLRITYFWEHAESLDWRAHHMNPYGGLLDQALRAYGVMLDPAVAFDLAGLWRRRRTHHGLHFNWISGHYEHRDRWRGFWRLARFGLLLMVARALGYRIVWTMHNLYPHERLVPRYSHWARLFITRLAHAVICHCEHARALAAKHFGRTQGVWVISHGTFRDAYPRTATRAAARERFGLPPQAFVYGFFGNVRRYKGVQHLVEAFRQMPGDDLRLLIAGGPYRLDTQFLAEAQQADPRIVMELHVIPNDEIQDVMAACDVMVMPFVTTLTSGSVITAIGFEKPVVIPAVGCLPALEPRGSCILIYDPRDPDGLLTTMRRARDLDLAQAARDAIALSDALNWDAIARRTIEAYGVPCPRSQVAA